MMPSAMDFDLVRVFTRAVGGATAETALPFNANFEVVLEVEAGQPLVNSGAQFAVGLLVRDLTTGANFAVTATPSGTAQTPTVATNANLASAAWPIPAVQFVYTVTAPGPATENDFCEALASVRVGVNNPDVEFATSPVFIIIRP